MGWNYHNQSEFKAIVPEFHHHWYESLKMCGFGKTSCCLSYVYNISNMCRNPVYFLSKSRLNFVWISKLSPLHVITWKSNVTINIPKKYHFILVELTKMINFQIKLIQIFKKEKTEWWQIYTSTIQLSYFQWEATLIRIVRNKFEKGYVVQKDELK